MNLTTTISLILRKVWPLFLGLVLITTSVQAATIYVDIDATGANDGTSWTDAFTDLNTAILSASSGDNIWLAEGVYKPSYVGDRSASFQFFVDVNIYGGFRGTETSHSERNWALYRSILSGNIGAFNDETDNSYHVVEHLGANIILNGIIVQKAYANGSQADELGAIVISGGSVTLRNSVVRDNYADDNLIHNFDGELNMLNCLIHENETGASVIGSGSSLSTFYAEHVTIANNSSTGIGTVFNTYLNNPLTLANSIVWGNLGFSGSVANQPEALLHHNIIEGGFSPTPNDEVVNLWDTNPFFADVVSNDFSLSQGSPAIDQADPVYTTTNNDLARKARTQNGMADLGAYEAPSVIYVDKLAEGANDGTSWANARTDLQLAINLSEDEEQIWVKKGTYYPTPYPNTDSLEREDTYLFAYSTEMYGGFNGTETALSQRDWKSNPTILSGEIGSPGPEDNSYNVVLCEYGTSNDPVSIIDGFIIEGGYANGPTTITNDGAAIRGTGELTVRNTIIRNNWGNKSILMSSGHCILESVLIHDNETEKSLFEIGTFSSHWELNNVTITENHVIDYDYLFPNGFSGYDITTSNSIYYGNTGIMEIMPPLADVTISHCIIGSGFTADSSDSVTNLYTANPQFVNPAANGFALSPGSPAINGGDNDAVSVSQDLYGESRIQNGTVDLGAYETPVLGYNVIYVDEDATGANDGSSWVNAYTDLQDALAVDVAGDHIWVAEGTYLPTSTTDRSISFLLDKDVTLVGGFNGTETSAAHRIYGLYNTSLVGDIGAAGDVSDNSYHVVVLPDTGLHFLDRFSIMGGSADGAGINSQGGGLRTGYSTTLQLTDMEFSFNYGLDGSAVHCGFGSEVSMDGCMFNYNEATNNIIKGGGYVTTTLNNVLAYGNTADQFLGVISPYDHADLRHCTFTENTVNEVWSGSGSVDCYNSIIWNSGPHIAANNNLLHHCVTDVTASNGLLTEEEVFYLDPQFENPPSSNFAINAMSPAFDAADSVYSSASDLVHVRRPLNGLPDIGCLEATACYQEYDLYIQSEEIHLDADTLFNSTRCAVEDNYDAMTCESTTGRNVWYFFEGPLSGNIEVFLDYVYGFEEDSDLSFEVYSDDSLFLTPLVCVDNTGVGESETAIIENLQNGSTYYIRIETPSNEDASFVFHITELTGESCGGDFDGSGAVNSADLLEFLSNFGCTSNCGTDLNNDGGVNSADLLTFLVVMGSVCP